MKIQWIAGKLRFNISIKYLYILKFFLIFANEKVKDMKKLKLKIGDKFGEWTIINTERFSKHGHVYVQCQCSCGVIKDVASTALLRGKTLSCKSCSKRKETHKFKIGEHIKHWTILEGPIYINGYGKYKVQCDCGTITYRLPIELLYKDRGFSCKKCSQKLRARRTTFINGRVRRI